MRCSINKPSQSILTSVVGRFLLSLTLLVTFWGYGKAEGVMDVGAPTHVKVPFYCKKIVSFNTRSGFDGFAGVHWELDHGKPIPLPDGTSEQYGHKALVSVFGPDLAALAGKPKGTIAFKTPYFIKYGDVTSGPYENDLASGDMNGDGFLDLVLLNSASQWVAIFYNDGDGNFPSTPSMEVNVSSSWDTTWLPDGAKEHPFQLVIGDLDGNGMNDFAVSYVHAHGWPSHREDFAVVAFFENGGSYRNEFVWGNQVEGKSLGCLDYRYGSPFYTIGATPYYGSIFQIMVARDIGWPNDSLFFRLDIGTIYKWDKLRGPIVEMSELLPKPLPLGVSKVPLFGSFIVTNLDSGPGLDIIASAGKNTVFDSGMGALSVFPSDLSLGPYGAVTAADFNLDGRTDLVSLWSDLPAGHHAGSLLRIVYGDGSAVGNPFRTGGRRQIVDLKVEPRWWENPAIMITGNFTGDFDIMTKKPFPSIMVLGADVVTIYPNVGNDLEQLNKPALEQLLTGPEALDNDTVRISGKYWLGMVSEVTDVILTADISGKVTTIPRTNLMIYPGMPEILEFTLPPGLAPGKYTVVVKNVRWTSNELKLEIIAKPRLDAILTGPEAKLSDTVLISGNFLLGTSSEITELALTPAMGAATSIVRASLTITAGMPDTLEFTVPGGLALGDYTVTVKNMRLTSNGLKLKIVP